MDKLVTKTITSGLMNSGCQNIFYSTEKSIVFNEERGKTFLPLPPHATDLRQPIEKVNVDLSECSLLKNT